MGVFKKTASPGACREGFAVRCTRTGMRTELLLDIIVTARTGAASQACEVVPTAQRSLVVALSVVLSANVCVVRASVVHGSAKGLTCDWMLWRATMRP